MDPYPFCKLLQNGILLKVKVLPGSSQSKIILSGEEYLKVKLHAPPVEGAANRELIKILKRKFRVAGGNIKIRRGEKSRIKEVEILGITYKEFLTAVSSPH